MPPTTGSSDFLQRISQQVPRPLVIRNYFGEQTASRLTDYAASNQSRFAVTNVYRDGRMEVNRSFRKSVGLRRLGSLGHEIKQHFEEEAPRLSGSAGIGAFVLSGIELEMVAHGDGAFFRRHIDVVLSGANLAHGQQRAVSCVYYFNAKPKGFSGGELRLYSFASADGGESENEFVDIEPEHDSLVVFASWVPHAVRSVSCPSGRFIDSRFALNCWLCCARPNNQHQG